jgi:hypothetical protein
MFHLNVFLHDSYAIGFVVSYEPFSSSNVEGLDFRTDNLVVINNTTHDLVLGKINKVGCCLLDKKPK